MTLLVDMAAATRITRLISTDSFPPVKHLRDWALDKVDPRGVRNVAGAEPPALAELIECNWCVGFWCSAAVVVARKAFPRWWGPVADVFATSLAVGLVAGLSEREGDLSDLGKTLDGIGLWLGTKLQAIADSMDRPLIVTGTLVDDKPVPDGAIVHGRVFRRVPLNICTEPGPHFHPDPVNGSPVLVDHGDLPRNQKERGL